MPFRFSLKYPDWVRKIFVFVVKRRQIRFALSLDPQRAKRLFFQGHTILAANTVSSQRRSSRKHQSPLSRRGMFPLLRRPLLAPLVAKKKESLQVGLIESQSAIFAAEKYLALMALGFGVALMEH